MFPGCSLLPYVTEKTEEWMESELHVLDKQHKDIILHGSEP